MISPFTAAVFFSVTALGGTVARPSPYSRTGGPEFDKSPRKFFFFRLGGPRRLILDFDRTATEEARRTTTGFSRRDYHAIRGTCSSAFPGSLIKIEEPTRGRCLWYPLAENRGEWGSLALEWHKRNKIYERASPKCPERSLSIRNGQRGHPD